MTKSRCYTLYNEDDSWLGQIVITEDGMFSSVTDYGNFSYSWRAFGGDFRIFLCGLDEQYFAGKIINGLSYTVFSKKVSKSCERFSEIVLPQLKKVIASDIVTSPGW